MKIALLGYGKMGRYIDRLATEDGDEVVLRIDADNRDTVTVAQLQTADVVIEFSRPDAAVANIEWVLSAGVPVVVGTTGWLEQLPQLTERVTAANGALFWASNFSIGVNIYFSAARQLAAALRGQGYTATIEETHHTEKVDAPSGTALTLAEVVEEVLGHRIPITSHREPDVPGTHVLRLRSPIDTLELAHTAHSREGFARGALAAARWLRERKGVYTMRDLLGTD
ncbi:4-hydroxy-tetrahydrodipicolinate reductase [Neolewinella maritima]|uniref:4-hydroxy-tetrahydrodipicolinate reductase n=1 Tax=Neolewinella maritima TaxID=1383882 RepID=A0ABN8F6F5_9BACT|nr:dihydrodipicolinate reductase C-terminal domain-containing protein [Neolewinella maritima]CAH1002149.1 4-hydroxy-tetrahydrodipicolinate reductase [Neolewinella maritima]